MNKTLTSIIGASFLAFSSAGCEAKYDKYRYNGKIGEEQVEFRSEYFWGDDRNFLTIRKPDGRVIKYADAEKNDLKLEWVEITKDDKTKGYTDNEIGKPVLEEAQKQFDNYLQKIKELKTKEGLDNLQ